MANVKKAKRVYNPKNITKSVFDAVIDTDYQIKGEIDENTTIQGAGTNAESAPLEASDNFTQPIENTVGSQPLEGSEAQKPFETGENTGLKAKRKYNKTGAYSKKKKDIAPEKPRFTIGSEPKNDFDTFKSDLAGFNQSTQNADKTEPAEEIIEPNEPAKTISSESAELVQGYMLLMFIDFIFPVAISFLFNKFNTKFYVDSKDLDLTDDEFRKLEPIADKAALYLNLRLNPALLLIISLGAIYSKKCAQVQKLKPLKTTKKAA